MSLEARPLEPNGSVVWVMKKREERRLEAAQMKFFRHLLGTTKIDKEKNQCSKEKNVSTENSKVNKTVPGEWLQQVWWMDANRIPKQALKYQPKGRRNIGRPRKRWRDQLHLED